MTFRYGSICSGIEAATVAWEPLGWEPAFFSEIDAFPRAVLSHHWPDVPLHGDFTTIKGDEYGPIDLLVGGTPCQPFSVAGLRGGLDDDRGNLALEFLRLADRTRPRWLVWENVPGVLSSNGGRDLGSILGGMVELGYGFAYRILDAQYFGVPQRRRRVFVVGYLGDWRPAAAVLFERHSLSGDTPPRRKTGQEVAGTLASRPDGGGFPGTDEACSGYVRAVALRGREGGATAELGDDCGNTLRASGGGGDKHYVMVPSTGAVSHCLNAGGMGRLDYETETMVAEVPVCIHGTQDPIIGYDHAHALGRNSGQENAVFAIQAGATRTNPKSGPGGVGVQPDIAYTLEARAEVQCVTGNITHTLRAEGFDASEDGTGRGNPIVAYAPAVSPTLRAGGNSTGGGRPPGTDVDTADSNVVMSNLRVRRLTPTECERLQGFPDGHTAIPYRGKPAADGPRYKALGNSMAVPVMRWIGRRIQILDMPLSAVSTPSPTSIHREGAQP